jgi:hypothetical protein
VPYLILGNIASTRIVVTESTEDFFFQYYAKLGLGLPLTPELLALTPDPYLVKPPRKGGMPAIFGENLGVWTVNDDVKQIIEELEPGVHTFIPVNLRVRGKDTDYGGYYLLYLGQAIDAIVIDETNFRDGFGREGFQKSWVLNTLVGPTVLDPNPIEGRHLWRGGWGKIGGGGDPFARYVFCSDELKTRIRKTKLDGWRFWKCKLSKSKSKAHAPRV